MNRALYDMPVSPMTHDVDCLFLHLLSDSSVEGDLFLVPQSGL